MYEGIRTIIIYEFVYFFLYSRYQISYIKKVVKKYQSKLWFNLDWYWCTSWRLALRPQKNQTSFSRLFFLRHVIAAPPKCRRHGQSAIRVTQSREWKGLESRLLSDFEVCSNWVRISKSISEKLARLAVLSLIRSQSTKQISRHGRAVNCRYFLSLILKSLY